MDYRDWEQKIKEKLEAASPEETGFSVNPEDIWGRIATRSKPRKNGLILFRPMVSHIAAAFLGILVSTLIYFLVFRHTDPGKTVTVTATIRKEQPMVQEPQARMTADSDQSRKAVASSDPHKTKTPLPRNMVTSKPHDLNKKTAGTGIRSESITDTVHEYAATNPDLRQRQNNTLVAPKVVYWSDIENNYKHKSEPKYWAALVHKIDKRLEKTEKSKNTKAPAIAWIQTFK